MPAPANVPDFLDLVRRSGLVPGAKIDDLLARHRNTGTPQTVDQAAGTLVREGLLTFFQSKQLRLGRYKRFTIGSKYRLLELIGAGGMGAVYLCEHTLMRRLVALKVLPVEKLDDHSNLERFYREARAVAALDHPNIVRAYDIDQYEKLHFLVMEYVDGTSLQEIVARYAMEKKLYDPVRAAQYIAQAAVGMQHAHELGMVHRDIKPGNLLLDRTGVIKVLDMGLARFFNKQQDSVTEKYDDKCVLGTADYLAPEQAVSNVVDVRADIYSLGGTLYFMLTGQTPFPDGTIAAKLVAHQTREPRPVTAFRADVPAGILAVLQKMMAKDPADRYQEPIEVAEALAEWADQQLPPPPDREMPTLCPLVQALMGPPPGASGQSGSLSRALFGPGRGVFARGPGSSGRLGSKSGDSRPAAPAPNGSTGGSGAVPFPTRNGSGSTANKPRPAGAPVSTARTNTSQTVPLPLRPSGAAPAPASRSVPKSAATPRPRSAPSTARATPAGSAAMAALVPPAPRRGWVFVLTAALVVALVGAAATAAYFIGRSNKDSVPASNLNTGKQADPEILTPAEAAEKVGEVETVQFQVAAVGTDPFELNSGPPTHFSVRVSAEHFWAVDDVPAEARRLKAKFDGKTVRVIGAVRRDPESGRAYIDVRSPDQIVIVGDR